ncbi:MAG: YlxR family protein [Coriobacteriia bacterium]|nr:YlxR family protein [Coriobacteriia bacterium]
MSTRTHERTCVICRSTDTKNGLLRIVRHPEGGVDYDPTGKMNGRGAYVCSLGCFDKAAKAHRLDGALKVKLTEEDYQRIGRQMLDALCPQQ